MWMDYSHFDLLLYLLLYSFVGWAGEVCYVAIREKRFVNRGFLNLPFALPYGVSAVILLVMLPSVERNYMIQYGLVFVVLCIIWSLTAQFVKGISKRNEWMDSSEDNVFGLRGFVGKGILAGIYLVGYLVVHPVFFGIFSLMPEGLTRVIVISLAVLVFFDLLSVIFAVRSTKARKRMEMRKQGTQRLGDRITEAIWKRLHKAYPGIWTEDNISESYVFAEGICFDKLVWVFLLSSFLGALIEMVYCRLVGGIWMNRSSVLYGAFSFVWGFGAVVLTITLQRLAGKEDRKVFLAGFVVGGVYEYFCSVFTEVVFGTVFWDYSHMPLNIGGRTNVLFCIFWGILAVVWVKILYPPMERTIENLSPLLGKILTWVMLVVMVCDGLLTMGAMIRYTDRQENPQAENGIELFLDTQYDDAWMEERWPNMKLR